MNTGDLLKALPVEAWDRADVGARREAKKRAVEISTDVAEGGSSDPERSLALVLEGDPVEKKEIESIAAEASAELDCRLQEMADASGAGRDSFRRVLTDLAVLRARIRDVDEGLCVRAREVVHTVETEASGSVRTSEVSTAVPPGFLRLSQAQIRRAELTPELFEHQTRVEDRKLETLELLAALALGYQRHGDGISCLAYVRLQKEVLGIQELGRRILEDEVEQANARARDLQEVVRRRQEETGFSYEDRVGLHLALPTAAQDSEAGGEGTSHLGPEEASLVIEADCERMSRMLADLRGRTMAIGTPVCSGTQAALDLGRWLALADRSGWLARLVSELEMTTKMNPAQGGPVDNRGPAPAADALVQMIADRARRIASERLQARRAVLQSLELQKQREEWTTAIKRMSAEAERLRPAVRAAAGGEEVPTPPGHAGSEQCEARKRETWDRIRNTETDRELLQTLNVDLRRRLHEADPGCVLDDFSWEDERRIKNRIGILGRTVQREGGGPAAS